MILSEYLYPLIKIYGHLDWFSNLVIVNNASVNWVSYTPIVC